MSQSVWWPLAMSAALLLGMASGCELILPFDEGKLTGGTGGTATTAGGTGGQATMTCSGCCTAADCPVDADPCIAATCDANVCGSKPVEDGAAAVTQTPADCKKAICVGGQVTNEPDVLDELDDGNPCTVDSCTPDGNPATSPAGPGTKCSFGGGTVCDGAGSCVECLVNGDCIDPEKSVCDLDTHSCISALCVDGMKNGTETYTDCGGGQCPPCDTGQDCKVDSDCASQKCAAGNKCAAPKCDDQIKNGDETDVDCGGSCSGCGPGQGCNMNGDCLGSMCTGMNGTCAPSCSDLVLNNGETDIDCGGANCNKCGLGKECAGLDSNCQSNFCDAASKCASKDPGGAPCASNATCASGNCTDGVCCNTTCQGTCKACNLPGTVGACTNIPAGQDPANECAGTDVCDGNGACGKALGQSCGNAGECISGFCTDGVCCADNCQGLCKACNVAGSLGTCSLIPNGTDPANECSGAMNNCNGAGACTN